MHENLIVRLTQQQIQKLDLSDAVRVVMAEGYERLPILAIDDCLTADPKTVTESVVATFLRGVPVASEVIAMPRRSGFGPRPVTIVGIEARAMLQALVTHLSKSVTLSPRIANGWQAAWQAHEAFGEQLDPETYVVDIDIASCYEYIDHKILVDELILQTSEVAYSTAIGELLDELTGQGVGLPQFLRSSDVLADIYLAMMERELIQAGVRLSRFADDFKILEERWKDARLRIEQAAEIARSYGLILSSEKTRVYKLSTAISRRQERKTSLQQYSEAALEILADVGAGDYDFRDDDHEVDEEEATALAMQTLLQDWLCETRSAGGVEHGSTLSYYVPKALRLLTEVDGDVEDDAVLWEMAFWHPSHLQLVAAFLLGRTADPGNLHVLERVIEADRQTPWGCLWVLDLATRAIPTDCEHSRIEEWAQHLLASPYEVIRAQACRYLAERRAVDPATVTQLFAASSPMARPAFACALGLLGAGEASALAASVAGDSPRAAAAYRAGLKMRGEAAGESLES